MSQDFPVPSQCVRIAREYAAQASNFMAFQEDELLRAAFRSIGLEEIADHVIKWSSVRMRNLLKRQADIVIEKREVATNSHMKCTDVAVFIQGKFFNARRVCIEFPH